MSKLKFVIIPFFILFLFSCTSIQDTLGTQLSGANKKGIPNKKSNDALMVPLTGETDTVLMQDFFPTALKLYEILSAQNPTHQGLLSMTGSLYVMYANVFVQHKAEISYDTDYELQYKEKTRAKMHYLRGRDYVLKALELRYPGFTEQIMSTNKDEFAKAVSKLKVTDVESLYWCGAGWLGAFSLDPLDTALLSTVTGALAMLEKACELDPIYNEGAIWEILTAFYAAAPSDFGGDIDKAVLAFQKTIEITEGKTIGPYLTYAQSFCKANVDIKSYEWTCPLSIQDLGWTIPETSPDDYMALFEEDDTEKNWPLPVGLTGFDWALSNALLINPDDDVSTRLATTVSVEKAEYLKNHRSDYFLIMEEE